MKQLYLSRLSERLNLVRDENLMPGMLIVNIVSKESNRRRKSKMNTK
jgi:hypothetical protein